ncbi:MULTISPECIES: response regulator transcription factor [unclassified Rhizobium]|jgi:DNA-binding NarL/FixJ family response regulator|uniref:response regulator n=1 Tax=unclassified Rhizobium TaxID=2613769 RepID=UPI000DDD50DA|nr:MULTISPECIES: response regulator transcription factor [unclassified Rhizobium]MBB3440929.1 DNA-binding NarL/FixJ family response regulator [Rhizobium sp. BK379]MBB3560157.1 DNA-binding NarL/FixJ family response regulator [Rhizobium sp. BK512]
MAPITVFLVDNHPVVVDGLRKVLDTYDSVSVVGGANDVAEALPLLRALRPRVVLLDINMPKTSGIDAITLIKAESPESRIVMLSMHDSREYISSSIMRGAAGYVLKEVPTSEVVEAIVTVAGGQTYFSSGVRDLLLNTGPLPTGERLTRREHEVARLVAAGKSNREIGDELGISEATVETHRKHLKRKLGVSTTADLVRFVLEHPDALAELPTSG